MIPAPVEAGRSIRIAAEETGNAVKEKRIKDTETTYQMVHGTICSEKIDTILECLQPAVLQAVQYVNRIIQEFKAWSEDKADRFSEND